MKKYLVHGIMVALLLVVSAHARADAPHRPVACDAACRLITKIYRVGLGRNPDFQGLSYWSEVLYSQGKEAVVIGVFSSPEYFQRHGNYYRGFVTGLYRELLQREPDYQGLNDWVKALEYGQLDLQGVAAGFVTGGEYQSHPRF